MKKIILLFAFLILFSFSYSQNNNKIDSIKTGKYQFIAAIGFPYIIELGGSVALNTKKNLFFETRVSPFAFNGNLKSIKMINLISIQKKLQKKAGLYGAFGLTSVFRAKYRTTFPWQYNVENESTFISAFYSPSPIIKLGLSYNINDKSNLSLLTDLTYFFWHEGKHQFLTGLSINYFYKIN